MVSWLMLPLLVLSGNMRILHIAILKSQVFKRKMDFFLFKICFLLNFKTHSFNLDTQFLAVFLLEITMGHMQQSINHPSLH